MRTSRMNVALMGVVGLCAACSDAGTRSAGPQAGGPTASEILLRPTTPDSTHAPRQEAITPPALRHFDLIGTTNGSGGWSQTPDSAGDDASVAIVADSLGNFLVAGTLGGNADVGCGAHVASPNEAYVAKYDGTTGACTWVTYLSGTDVVAPSALSLGASDSVYVAGSFAGTALLGSTQFVSAGGLDGFVMQVTTGGVVSWAKKFGGAQDEFVFAAATHGSNVAVAGAFYGTSAFGGTATAPVGDADAFIVEYTGSAPGTFVAQNIFGGIGWDDVSSLAVTGGGLAANGTFTGTAFSGAQTLVSAGGQDAFVAVYDATLTPVATRRMGGTLDDAAHGMVVSGTEIVVSGYFQQSADMGDLAPLTGNGKYTGFLSSYAASNLAFVRALSIDSLAGGEVVPEGLTSDVNGGVLMTGHFAGTSAFGTAAGSSDGFVATYTSTGAFRWSTALGSSTSGEGIGVASTTGQAVVVGSFTGTVAFASPVVNGAGARALLWSLVDNAP